MNLHYFQHVPFEGLGQIQAWADDRGHRVTGTRLFAEERMPPLEDMDVLIVMGGPMGALDDSRFSWMKREKLFIEESIKREKSVLGICLGAQLMANVLGARVAANRVKEIGWFPIELDPPNARTTALSALDQRSVVFHWHGDTFDLPPGALHLARSEACENQAFSVGSRVIGLQFHLEIAAPHMDTLIAGCRNELVEGPFIQDPREMQDLAERFAPHLETYLYRFLDRFTGSNTLRPSRA